METDIRTDNVLERIVRGLERQNRRMKHAGAVVLSCLLLVVAFSSGALKAQETAAGITSIFDVKEGMSRESVLAGLKSHYRLENQNLPDFEETHLEGFDVFGKELTEAPSYSITFLGGKVFSVDMRLFPPMTGESVQFAERLFRLLYQAANPPKEPTDLEKAVNVRSGVAQIQLQEKRGDNLDEEIMFFTIGKDTFRITISKLAEFPAQVVFDRILGECPVGQSFDSGLQKCLSTEEMKQRHTEFPSLFDENGNPLPPAKK